MNLSLSFSGLLLQQRMLPDDRPACMFLDPRCVTNSFLMPCMLLLLHRNLPYVD